MNRENLAILSILVLLTAFFVQALLLFLPPMHSLFPILLATLIFLLSFVLFDRLLWRWFRIGKRPDIHGDWLGRLSSSYQENSMVEPIRVRIIQRWLTTRVDFIGQHSTSSSLASVFYRETDGQYRLAYIYRVQPFKQSEEIMTGHTGLSILRLVESGRLSGYYHHLDSNDGGLEFVHGQIVLTRN